MRNSFLQLARAALAVIALGVSLASALPFNADYRVSTLPGSSQSPRIAGETGTSNLHLVWTETTGGPTTTEVWYARSIDNGSSWQAPKQITNNAVQELYPSVSAANGNVIIVWGTDFNTGGIYYARSTDSGANFGAVTQLWDQAGYSRNPEILSEAAGQFTVTWYDSNASGGAEVGHIFITVTCDAGATWSPVQDLTANDGQVDSETPQLALDSNGIVWLTFRSTRNGDPQAGWPPYQQYIARRTARVCPTTPGTGSTKFLWPPAPISPGLPDALTSVYGSAIATGIGGRVHIAYWDNNAGNNLSFRTGTVAAGFGLPQNLSLLGPNNPMIAAGNSDIAGPGIAQDNRAGTPGVNVFWWEETGIAEGFRVGKLKYRESLDAGVTFSAATDLTSSTVTMTPKALYFGGRVHVVWSDYRNAPVTSSEIYHKFANEDGSLSSAPAVSLSETAYLFPDTAVGATSAGHAFTLTNTGGTSLSIAGVGVGAEFGQTNNCPATLGVGASCTITATFSPAATGLRSASITISDNASGNPHSIALTGNGAGGSADSDNDGVPNSVEPGEGLNPAVKDNNVFGVARLFAMQQYRDFLNREGDSGGITFWTNQINTAAQTRGQCVESFFNSAEFQSTVAPVARLYFAYFLRIPDYAGLQFWINYYKSGHSLDEVSNAFAGSPEFASRYGSLTNSQFVTLVYQNVLGRNPDSAGLAYWTDQLDTAARTRGQVMLGFSESAEYQSTSFNKIYVTMMYVGMLRRAPDQGGFDFWVGYLGSGNSGLALINGFLTSQEYHDRFLP